MPRTELYTYPESYDMFVGRIPAAYLTISRVFTEFIRVHPESLDRRTVAIGTALAISRGEALGVGAGLDLVGSLPYLHEALADRQVVEELAVVQKIQHPHMEANHRRRGYTNLGGIVSLLHGGVQQYAKFMGKQKNNPALNIDQLRFVWGAAERADTADYLINDIRLAVPEYRQIR